MYYLVMFGKENDFCLQMRKSWFPFWWNFFSLENILVNQSLENDFITEKKKNIFSVARHEQIASSPRNRKIFLTISNTPK